MDIDCNNEKECWRDDPEFPEMNVLDKHPERYKIDAQSEFVVFELIRYRLFELFNKKNIKNNAGWSDKDLLWVVDDVYTWLKETHHIYKFYFNKLDDLVKFVDEHIMDPGWSDDIRLKLKQLWEIK